MHFIRMNILHTVMIWHSNCYLDMWCTFLLHRVTDLLFEGQVNATLNQVWSVNFITRLLLGLELNLVLLASSTNVKSGPQFAEVGKEVNTHSLSDSDRRSNLFIIFLTIRLIPEKSIPSSISITVQACAKGLYKNSLRSK